MSTAHHVEILQKEYLLLIDPGNSVGKLVANKVKNDFRVVLASKAGNKLAGVHNVDLKPHKKRLPNLRYSSIVVFYNGEDYILDMLPELAKKTSLNNARLIISIPATLATTPLLNKIYYVASRAQIAILGDIFGNLNGLSSHTSIDNMLFQAKKHKKLLLSEQGLIPFYPIALADVVERLVHIIYSTHKHAAPLLLLPSVVFTELSLARMLQKLDPSLAIDFSSQPVTRQVVLPEGTYLLTSTYDVQEKIEQAYEQLSVIVQPTNIVAETVQKKSRLKRYSFATPKYIILSIFFTSIVLPFVLSLLLTLIGFLGLLFVKEQYQHGKLSYALPVLAVSHKAFYLANQPIKITSAEFSLIGQKQLLASYIKTVKSAEIGTNVLEATISFLQPYETKSAITKESFAEKLSSLKVGLDSLTNLQTSGDLSPALASLLSANQETINFVNNTSDSWTTLAGFDKSKTYLVLFQNNMELRPTGGFIGSYGILKAQDGQIKDFSVHDVYDADGQLKTHVEPPYPIRRYIPQVHLYMRDSNFDPDYPTSAKTVAQLYSLETGTKVDGVISVDLTFVKYIIASLGSIYVPDYHETVTADSLFLATEKHAEKNFFPGSTQKKDFLQALFLAVQQRFNEKKDISYESLLSGFSQALSEKHVIFAFNDPTVQSEFAANNYSDSLVDQRTQRSNTINDFLAINEANIGINKVNYFMKRKINQKVHITGDGKIQETLDLYYLNTSTNAWPGGTYRNYLRLIAPQGATLSGVTINGQSQAIVPAVTDFQTYEAKGFASPAGLEVATSQELGKTVFGMVLAIAPSEYKHVTISYELPQGITNQSDLIYTDRIIKQPGTENDPATFSLTTPQGYNVLTDNGVTNEVSKDFHLSADTDLSYHIAKQ